MSLEQIMISVLMPVYNGEKYLAEAIDSILNQSFRNFELLILLEYGSNEESKRIIAGYTDDRIKVIENTERLGLPLSLNKGIDFASGKYIARMDTDDVSLVDRFKIQYEFLEAHPEISLCGSSIRINGKGRKMPVFESAEAIKFGTYFECPFYHPTIMWRKDDLRKENLYYRNLPQSEDYDLWTRVIPSLQVFNINKVLLNYRVHSSNKSALGIKVINKIDDEVKREFWSKTGLNYDSCIYKETLPEDINNKIKHIELHRIKCVADNTDEFDGKRRYVQRYVLNYLLSNGYSKNEILMIIKENGLFQYFSQKEDYLYMMYRILRHGCRKLVDKMCLWRIGSREKPKT